MSLLKRPKRHRLACLWMLIGGVCYGANSDVKLEIREQWRNIFGGDTLVLHVLAETVQPRDGILSYSASAASAVIVRRETALRAAPEGTPAVIDIDIPEVKAGIRMPLQVKLSFRFRDNIKPEVEKILRFTVFPRDAFHLSQKQLETLHLGLYDPDGETSTVFRKADLPFVGLNTIAACLAHNGLVIIGEGLGDRTQKQLCQLLPKAAADGKKVLVLMPEEASFSLEFKDGDRIPEQFSLQTAGVIRVLDKKLDAKIWGTGRNSTGAVCQLVAVRNQMFAEFAKADQGWSWLDMDFADNGKLLVVGFPIIQAWEESPTPRFLLRRLFDYVKKEEVTQ